MHTKFCIIDNEIVLKGSLNFTHKAFKSNYEFFEVHNCKQTALTFSQAFFSLWKDPNFMDISPVIDLSEEVIELNVRRIVGYTPNFRVERQMRNEDIVVLSEEIEDDTQSLRGKANFKLTEQDVEPEESIKEKIWKAMGILKKFEQERKERENQKKFEVMEDDSMGVDLKIFDYRSDIEIIDLELEFEYHHSLSCPASPSF
jgi:hypothetical protein